MTDELHAFFIQYRFWLSPKELSDLILCVFKVFNLRKGTRVLTDGTV